MFMEVVACLAVGALLACSDDERVCADVECFGLPVQVPLVDEDELPLAARGELRNPTTPQESFPFDCTAPWPDSKCQSNFVVTGNYVYSPEYAVEIRFVQSDDSFSSWQSVNLDFSRETNPDFNGLGCSCSYYSATAASVIVPVTARRTIADPAG